MKSDHIHTPIAIIGGGPIGIELAIALERLGRDYILFEARQIGNFISSWPPNTRFFSTLEHVALAGVPFQNLDQQSPTGEQYLAYMRMLVEMYALNLHLYEPVIRLRRQGDRFELVTRPRTGERAYLADRVVLATGGMSRPRRLGIPGEDLPHVTHLFPGPHHYFRQRLLVVGGKNSALEAALRCWRAGAKVTLSYRRANLDYERVKPHLAADIRDRLGKGEIEFKPGSIPVKITPEHVVLASTAGGGTSETDVEQHATDFVLLATGFEADMSMFDQIGAKLLGAERAPLFDPCTMETSVPGLHVAGTAAGGTQLNRFTHFISTSHDHVARIVRAITGESAGALGSVPARNNAVTYQEIKAN